MLLIDISNRRESNFEFPKKSKIFEKKKSNFQNFGVMDPVAWDRITFLFRNAQSSYFGKIKFKHIDAAWVGGIFKIQLFEQRKSDFKFARPPIVQAPIVEQSPLLMQLLFGVTTLRVILVSWTPLRGTV